VKKHFDYIIVGSGAAGSVVAARLAQASTSSNKSVSICVLEAGGSNKKWLVDIPAGFVRNLNNPNRVWQFGSEPTENTGGRSVYLPQGKLLGGSTSINGLVYNRGQAEDFDSWADSGNAGWSYRDVLPYFRKSENFAGAHSQHRGNAGPLRIGEREQTPPLCDAFIHSVADLAGVPVHNDYNGESQIGTGYYQRFIHNGKRENVAGRFLEPQLEHDNITLMTNTLALRVSVEQGRAVHVDCMHNGVDYQLVANKEILVCAGTVNSAALLQRSGIGQSRHLRSVGVPVVHELPGVGDNLQDHYFARLAFRLHDGVDSLNTQAQGLRLAREVIRWARRKPSILAWSPSIAYAFLNAESVLSGERSTTTRPDLQFVFSHGSYRPGRVYELDRFPAVTCGFTQQRPFSKGSVRISSPNASDKPIVQPNYLHDDRDKRLMVKGVNIARLIMSSQNFKSVVSQEQFPGVQTHSDENILEFIRNTGNTGYHLVGTCKMGPANDPLAVVDADLRVHGLDGIRVIDASVMPSVTSSNTCAATIMIGEKAADLILER